MKFSLVFVASCIVKYYAGVDSDWSIGNIWCPTNYYLTHYKLLIFKSWKKNRMHQIFKLKEYLDFDYMIMNMKTVLKGLEGESGILFNYILEVKKLPF